MLTEQRHRLITELIENDGAVRISDLLLLLGASEATVRRDINALADIGVLQRVHGGGVRPRPRRVETTTTTPADGPQLGLMVPSTKFYWGPIIRSIQTAAAQRGCRVHLGWGSYDGASDREAIERLLAAGAQGLLLAPAATGEDANALSRWLSGIEVPVVLVERTLGEQNLPVPLPVQALDRIRTDNVHGAAEAVRHLAALGHRRIALFTTRTSPSGPAIRVGWRTGLAQVGVTQDEIDDLLDVNGPGYPSAGWAEILTSFVDDVLRSGTTAMVVNSNPEAIGILHQLDARGVSVPDALSIVAYDDEVPAQVSEPALTAVRQPKPHLGIGAVDLLLARLGPSGAARPVHHLDLLPELVLRASTAPVPTGAATAPVALA